mgnify:CR=1 FL=1
MSFQSIHHNRTKSKQHDRVEGVTKSRLEALENRADAMKVEQTAIGVMVRTTKLPPTVILPKL